MSWKIPVRSFVELQERAGFSESLQTIRRIDLKLESDTSMFRIVCRFFCSERSQ